MSVHPGDRLLDRAEVPLPAGPWAVTVDPDSGDALVALRHRPGARRVPVADGEGWTVDGLAHSPTAVATGADGLVAVATHLGGRLHLLDRDTGSAVAEVAVPGLSAAVTADGEGGWIVAGTDLVDVRRGTDAAWTASTSALPAPATSLAAEPGRVWIGHAAGVATRGAGTTITTLLTTPGPCVVACPAGRSQVWAADHRGRRLALLDDAGRVEAEVAVDGHPWHMVTASAEGGGGPSLGFVALPDEHLVAVVDLERAEVTGTLAVSRPWSLAFDDRRRTLWVASPLDGVLHRIPLA